MEIDSTLAQNDPWDGLFQFAAAGQGRCRCFAAPVSALRPGSPPHVGFCSSANGAIDFNSIEV
jgi:hypothetical protein